MSSLPIDVLSEIVSWVSVSAAVKYATLNRAILPACRRRIYYDVLLSWRKLRRFMSHASHLLHITRILRLDNSLLPPLSIQSSDTQKLLKIILKHAVLERLEYQGKGDGSMWDLVLQVSCLPSFVWLGISLDCTTEVDDYALRFLRNFRLRQLDFHVCKSIIVPPRIHPAPLPPIRRLTLDTTGTRTPVSDHDVYEQWAAMWLNLEEVQDLTIFAYHKHECPSLPNKNQFQIVRFHKPHIDSLILQLPALLQLKYLIISTAPEPASQIVRSLPTMIHFTFIIILDSWMLRHHTCMCIQLANFIATRRDCDRFILRATIYTMKENSDGEKKQACIEWIRSLGFPIEKLPVQVHFIIAGELFSFMDRLSTVT
ncbi:hypothetical protein DL96DRAFT_1642634 [Flagelloscypha sp. PMI_526]|nr:hypothetical protein DL96DRAFT_1642634 [Flagelloscypha sp. PMI_526]